MYLVVLFVPALLPREAFTLGGGAAPRSASLEDRGRGSFGWRHHRGWRRRARGGWRLPERPLSEPGSEERSDEAKAGVGVTPAFDEVDR